MYFYPPSQSHPILSYSNPKRRRRRAIGADARVLSPGAPTTRFDAQNISRHSRLIVDVLYINLSFLGV